MRAYRDVAGNEPAEPGDPVMRLETGPFCFDCETPPPPPAGYQGYAFSMRCEPCRARRGGR